MTIFSRINSRQLVIFSLAALVVGSIPVFGTRFLNDMDFYSLFADKVLSGHLLYRDALDVKPPLIFLHYALVFKVFGTDNAAALKVVTVGWLGLSAMVMSVLRQQLSPRSAMPAWAAAWFVVSSFSGWGEEFLSSNSELLANLFILVGVWALAAEDFSSRRQYLVVGGICLGVAFLYRYQSGAALAAYLTTILLCSNQFNRKIERLALVGVGFALPSLAFVAYYLSLGAIGDLRLMTALQTFYGHDADAFHLPTLLGRVLIAIIGLWPMLILAVLQAVAIVRKYALASRSEIFMLAFAAWSAAAFFAGGRLRSHYFVQSIPALVLLATERLDPKNKDVHGTGPGARSWFAVNAFLIQVAAALVFTIVNGTYYWTRRNSKPDRDVVAFINAHSDRSDEVLLWAWRPNVLFDSQRVFATRLLVNSPLIGQLEGVPSRADRGPVRRAGLPELWPAFLGDLVRNPPKLIIDEPPGRSEWSMDHYPQFASVLSGYQPCQVLDGVCVYLRRD